eukprot:tig00000842_g4849.t1
MAPLRPDSKLFRISKESSNFDTAAQHPLYTALQEKFKKEQEELVQKYKAREDNENARHQAELKAITDELSAELKTLSERQHTQKMEFEKNLKTLLAAVLQQAPGPAGGGMSGAFPSQQPVMHTPSHSRKPRSSLLHSRPPCSDR